MKIFRSLLLMAFVNISFYVNAQERLIQGIVTTFDSIPLIGAEVKINSTKQVILTDTLGRFSALIDSSKDKIKISARGFYTQNLKTDYKVKLAMINLKLKSNPNAREYAIGYGYVKDADKLNAVSQLSKDDLDFSQYSDIYDLIRGRVAGVAVAASGDIIIRGISSINSSSAALIVVDGVPVDNSVLQSMSPTNVKSIDIIKDGSAAIYGARGANGVVLIETRKGEE